MPVIDFEEFIGLRIKNDELKKLKRVVRKNSDVYLNISHFIRCSIIKELRGYDEQGKKLRRVI